MTANERREIMAEGEAYKICFEDSEKSPYEQPPAWMAVVFVIILIVFGLGILRIIQWII